MHSFYLSDRVKKIEQVFGGEFWHGTGRSLHSVGFNMRKFSLCRKAKMISSCRKAKKFSSCRKARKFSSCRKAKKFSSCRKAKKFSSCRKARKFSSCRKARKFSLDAFAFTIFVAGSMSTMNRQFRDLKTDVLISN